jgi:shikimate dehydrogenase
MQSGISNPFDFQFVQNVDNYAVMGNPVAHSKSPQIHQIFAAQTLQSIHYQAIYVPLGEFHNALDEFNRRGGKGLNVTVPFKQDAFQLVTTTTDRARLASAVNTISFARDGSTQGDNTDGVGLLRDLQQNNIPISGMRILILGAGGAVRGILGPLLEQQPRALVIANRTLVKAEQLLASYPIHSQLQCCDLAGLVDMGSFDLIINGISAGLSGTMPELPDSLLHNDSRCYDMVYADSDTVFIRWAKSKGVSTALDGLGMLVEQAAEAFFIWRGVRPETAPVIRLLRNELSEELGVRSEG